MTRVHFTFIISVPKLLHLAIKTFLLFCLLTIPHRFVPPS